MKGKLNSSNLDVSNSALVATYGYPVNWLLRLRQLLRLCLHCLLLRCANFGAFFANTVDDDNEPEANETGEVSDLEAMSIRYTLKLASIGAIAECDPILFEIYAETSS